MAKRDALADLLAEISFWSDDDNAPVDLRKLRPAAVEIVALRARVAKLKAALRDVMPLAAAHFLSVEERERIAAARRALEEPEP